MSSPLAAFREALASVAAERQGLSPDEAQALVGQIRRQPDGDRGDLAFPCFALAKQLKRKPQEVATEVAEALKADDRWASVETAGPYVNVTYQHALLAQTVVPAARDERYGTWTAGAGKTVVIDFSAPNIAKPLAFHHLRSTVIGQAISNIHAACGWTVAGINYIGDWGKQFGLLATGFQRHGDPARRADSKYLVEIYVKANREADVAGREAKIAAPETAQNLINALKKAKDATESESDPKAKKKAEKSKKSLEKKLRGQRNLKDGDPLDGIEGWLNELHQAAETAKAALPEAKAKDELARGFLKRMEDKDPEALAEWTEFRSASVADFDRIYKRMGISFAATKGESAYQDVLEDTVAEVRKKPGTQISDGAEIVNLTYEKSEPPAMVKTRAGTTLYITRDIAAARDRYDTYRFDRALYVVGQAQSLHFNQLFRVLTAMGHSWAERRHHVPFGRVHGMGTRRGQVVFLDEVLDESCQKARAICEASGKIDQNHLDDTVEAIGVGAIMFGDLRNLRTSDYHFDWDQVLDFSGRTAPYVQFSHARTCSIIRKGGGVPASADPALLTLTEERAVIVALAKYPDAVMEACETFEPSVVTRALIEIAEKTASYLTAGNRDRGMRVLLEDNAPLRNARLHLVDGIRHCLAHGLSLLGCRAPEAM